MRDGGANGRALIAVSRHVPRQEKEQLRDPLFVDLRRDIASEHENAVRSTSGDAQQRKAQVPRGTSGVFEGSRGEDPREVSRASRRSNRLDDGPRYELRLRSITISSDQR